MKLPTTTLSLSAAGRAAAVASSLTAVGVRVGHAEDTLSRGAGIGVVPTFIGSEDYSPIPLPYVEYKRGGRTVRTNQAGFEVDLTRRSSLDLLVEDKGTKIDLSAMPRDGVTRCRAAWARLAGRETCVVHGDANAGNVRMTADRVALIDWDEAHVDVADLDLVLPYGAGGLRPEPVSELVDAPLFTCTMPITGNVGKLELYQ